MSAALKILRSGFVSIMKVYRHSHQRQVTGSLCTSNSLIAEMKRYPESTASKRRKAGNILSG